jgi:hypothetical protein
MVFDPNILYGHPVFYLDPGSGSFLIQLLLAAGLGLGVAVKMYWTKIKSIFRGKKADPAPAPDEEDEE